MRLRLIVLSAALFLLIALQLGFVHALPEPFRFTPLLLVIAVYSIQHHGQEEAAVWLVGFGALSDYWHVGVVPGGTAVYAAAAVLAIFLARHVFSNRSFYGVLACTISALALVIALESGIAFILWLRDSDALEWGAWLHAASWQLILAVLAVLILFPFGKQFRRTLSRMFLLSSRRETY